MANDSLNEMFVVPAYNSRKFLDIFLKMNGELNAAKWKEIKLRTGIADEIQILVDTALELTTSSEQTQLFRKTDDANETLIAIWFAELQKKAKRIFLASTPPNFSSLNGSELREIAQMSVSEESPLYIGDYLLKNFGIILVINRGFSGMKLDGVATRLTSGNPVIGLSLRYSRYNNFWFTLLHELSHVSLHYDSLVNVIYDDLDELDTSEIEKEANRLAADSIIPRHLYNKSPVLRSNLDQHVFDLASQAKVHPALVAGAIQHKTRNYQTYANIVNFLDVRNMLGVAE